VFDCILVIFYNSMQHNGDKKHFFLFQLIHTVVKIIEMLKQFKIITPAPTCFGSRTDHHQGAVLCLACGSQWTARLHNRLICRNNIDSVYTDEHRKTMLCSFS
jgi:hypothetical protein